MPSRKVTSQTNGRGWNPSPTKRDKEKCIYESNRGRLRARPVDETASNKEWQRSKFCVANSKQKFRAPQQEMSE